MFKSPPERADVRDHVDEMLCTDADLDAFCVDHFPDVHRRFGKGMERTEKVNLLFSLVELADIVAKLRERGKLRVVAKQRAGGWWTATSVVLLVVLGGGLYVALYRGAASGSATLPGAPPLATGQRAASTTAAPAPMGINSGNVILDSAGAQLKNRAPSSALRDLGTTINSGNRIEGSPGAGISNEVGGP